MDLSQQSITGRQFELNRRGYDPDTVDAHLAEIAGAVAEREREFNELKSTVGSLQAKVQDANESEEALRLTLKAAAHAKEELLAGARDQAKAMQEEAAANAEKVISEASAAAEQATAAAEARVKAMEEGAQSRAGEVAKAALAESEALVTRIEGLRANLEIAERALAALKSQTAPQIEESRAALDTALAAAREAAEDPAVLAQSAAVATTEPETPSISPPENAPEPAPVAGELEAEAANDAVRHGEASDASSEGGGGPSAPEQDQVASSIEGSQDLREAMSPEAGTAAPQEEPAPAAEESPAPHLEVVAQPEQQEGDESSADISDKVDRLLEELREVT